MKNKIKKVSTFGAAICSVSVAVTILYNNLNDGNAEYPLRVRKEFVVDVTGKWEGCRFEKYRDTGGIETVGIGTTSNVCGELTKKRYSYDEIAYFFNKGLYQSEQCINKNFKGSNLPQSVYESLVDMAYNNGCSAISNNKSGKLTKIRKLALQGKYKDLCNAYMEWVYGRNIKGEKVVIKGLYNRRLDNKEWCLKDV